MRKWPASCAATLLLYVLLMYLPAVHNYGQAYNEPPPSGARSQRASSLAP